MRQCIVRKIVFLEKTFRTMHNLMISYGRGKRSHCKSEMKIKVRKKEPHAESSPGHQRGDLCALPFGHRWND